MRMRTACAFAAFIGTVALGAGAANAHAALVESNPAEGARLDALPAAVSVTLNEPLAGRADLVLRGPSGDAVRLAEPTIDGATASAAVAATSPMRGMYTLAYRVASADGHTVTGTISFSVAGGQPAASADEPEPATATTTRIAASTGGSVAILLIFLAVVTGVIVMLIRAGMGASGHDGPEDKAGDGGPD